MTPACVNGKEAAKYLGIKYSTFSRDWPSWVRFGIVPSRYNGNPHSITLWRIEDLNRLLDKWKVVTP